MASNLFDPDDPLIALVKQCVMAEYVPLSELAEESAINVLINHGDTFEWMDITTAIPAGSERTYAPPDQPKLTRLQPKA
jgi:hypothetical protein